MCLFSGEGRWRDETDLFLTRWQPRQFGLRCRHAGGRWVGNSEFISAFKLVKDIKLTHDR